ncbi:MAG: polymer-forming cytoskeletal protein [Bacteroidota bacterium]
MKEAVSNASNIIGKGTSLDGNLDTAGNLRVEGKVIGSIQSKAKIVLSNTALVEGNIIAQNAEIGGEVQGTVRITGLLILKPTALINGDIITAKLVFEEGAKFNGKCNMGGPVKETKLTKTPYDLHKQNGNPIAQTLEPVAASKKQ